MPQYHTYKGGNTLLIKLTNRGSSWLHRTATRKTVWKIEDYTTEPDSKAQCMALEDNVKEFGLTYFGFKDRRQGMLRI